jgi:hypothetical protein
MEVGRKSTTKCTMQHTKHTCPPLSHKLRTVMQENRIPPDTRENSKHKKSDNVSNSTRSTKTNVRADDAEYVIKAAVRSLHLGCARNFCQ